ncbi:MAG: serine/threonine protein kinase [Polyangiaceae bacterium]|nr:serine/threonine protein kinase [Polyangiaceae bacterium]
MDELHARIGTYLGRYRLDRLLGRGGMATVYAATHALTGDTVAIKVLHPELGGGVRRRFAQEGMLANKVKHPGVVRVIDVEGPATGDAYMVMDFVEGTSLREYLARTPGPLPVQEAVAITLEVLAVLEAARKAGVVHRDINPANVFLDASGRVRVLDFGLARSGESDNDTQAFHIGMGTPGYAAPEQIVAQSKVDHRADLWSVGAMLFRLVTGRALVEGDSSRERWLRSLAPLPRVATLAPELPRGLALVIETAVAFERDDRWSSAAAMAASLRPLRTAAVVDLKVTVREPPPESTAVTAVAAWPVEDEPIELSSSELLSEYGQDVSHATLRLAPPAAATEDVLAGTLRMDVPTSSIVAARNAVHRRQMPTVTSEAPVSLSPASRHDVTELRGAGKRGAGMAFTASLVAALAVVAVGAGVLVPRLRSPGATLDPPRALGAAPVRSMRAPEVTFELPEAPTSAPPQMATAAARPRVDCKNDPMVRAADGKLVVRLECRP